MTSLPPPVGIPTAPIVFDLLRTWGVGAIIALVALAVLLWALRSRPRSTFILTCPEHGTVATIVVRRRRGRAADVGRCTLCDPPMAVTCHKRCLRLVA